VLCLRAASESSFLNATTWCPLGCLFSTGRGGIDDDDDEDAQQIVSLPIGGGGKRRGGARAFQKKKASLWLSGCDTHRHCYCLLASSARRLSLICEVVGDRRLASPASSSEKKRKKNKQKSSVTDRMGRSIDLDRVSHARLFSTLLLYIAVSKSSSILFCRRRAHKSVPKRATAVIKAASRWSERSIKGRPPPPPPDLLAAAAATPPPARRGVRAPSAAAALGAVAAARAALGRTAGRGPLPARPPPRRSRPACACARGRPS
jgi:hypothetical protein